MAKEPVISIICALRNDGRFIRGTLETVVSQTYPHWELIIMDGASTDNTVEIVKEYAERYPNIIWRSEPDEGQWHALDKALALAKGKHLMMLCGQDGYLDKEWFERCVEVLEQKPEVSLVWGIPFNMSEEGKLFGPHYAYAQFLKDDRFGSRIKPLDAITAKIDWSRPAWFKRLGRLLRKMTFPRMKMALRSFRKEDIPQKEEWFFYWLKTHRAFPEGNMCMRKEVYVRNTKRFPEETMTNGALFDFCFNFNARGYLAYGLPIAASFGRTHAGSQLLGGSDKIFLARYGKDIADFAEKLEKRKSILFIDAMGKVVSKRTLTNL